MLGHKANKQVCSKPKRFLRPNFIQCYDHPWMTQVLELYKCKEGQRKIELEHDIHQNLEVKNKGKLKLILEVLEEISPKLQKPDFKVPLLRQDLVAGAKLETLLLAGLKFLQTLLIPSTIFGIFFSHL